MNRRFQVQIFPCPALTGLMASRERLAIFEEPEPGGDPESVIKLRMLYTQTVFEFTGGMGSVWRGYQAKILKEIVEIV